MTGELAVRNLRLIFRDRAAAEAQRKGLRLFSWCRHRRRRRRHRWCGSDLAYARAAGEAAEAATSLARVRARALKCRYFASFQMLLPAFGCSHSKVGPSFVLSWPHARTHERMHALDGFVLSRRAQLVVIEPPPPWPPSSMAGAHKFDEIRSDRLKSDQIAADAGARALAQVDHTNQLAASYGRAPAHKFRMNRTARVDSAGPQCGGGGPLRPLLKE